MGNPSWLAEQGIGLDPLNERVLELKEDGDTVVAVGRAFRVL